MLFLGLGLAGLGLAPIVRTISREAGAESRTAAVPIWLGALSAAVALIVVVLLTVGFLTGLSPCQQLGSGDHQIGSWTLT
jgi:putative copper export protein